MNRERLAPQRDVAGTPKAAGSAEAAEQDMGKPHAPIRKIKILFLGVWGFPLHHARCVSQRSCRSGGPHNASLWGRAFPVNFSFFKF
jgi:hypothetical protein